MHDKEMKAASYEEICDLKKRLIEYVSSAMASGMDKIDTCELGEAIDMIKDLSEAEEKCQKACYYSSITKAMREAEEYEGKMGYGRHHVRMNPMNPEWRDDDDIYRGPYPEMSNMRMGYPMDKDMWNRGKDGRFREQEMEDPRYGKAYNEFRKARRHYTETKSVSDKQMMEEHANEHLSDSMQSLKEIWEASDPTLRKKMKADLQKFANDLPA